MKNSEKKFVVLINNHKMFVNSLEDFNRLNKYANDWRKSSFSINTKKFKVCINHHILMVDTVEEGKRLYETAKKLNAKFVFKTWNNICSKVEKIGSQIYFIFPWMECTSPSYIIDSGNDRENNRRQDIANGCPKHLAGMAY